MLLLTFFSFLLFEVEYGGNSNNGLLVQYFVFGGGSLFLFLLYFLVKTLFFREV